MKACPFEKQQKILDDGTPVAYFNSQTVMCFQCTSRERWKILFGGKIHVTTVGPEPVVGAGAGEPM